MEEEKSLLQIPSEVLDQSDWRHYEFADIMLDDGEQVSRVVKYPNGNPPPFYTNQQQTTSSVPSGPGEALDKANEPTGSDLALRETVSQAHPIDDPVDYESQNDEDTVEIRREEKESEHKEGSVSESLSFPSSESESEWNKSVRVSEPSPSPSSSSSDSSSASESESEP
jgi:hypothetical protein